MSRGRLEVASAVESPLGTPLLPGVRQKGGRYEGRLKFRGKEYRVTGATPEEAFAKLQELHLRLAGACARAADAAGGASEQRAPASPGQLLTLAELLAQWMQAHPEWKPRTRAEYEELAARWLQPSLGRQPLALLSPRDIEVLLRSMPTRQAAKVYAMLRAAFRTAYRWGCTNENIMECVQPPRYQPPRRDLPPPEAMAQALSLGRDHPWWSWVALAVSTGLRPGEQAALRWEDWEPERNLLFVRRSGQYIRGQWVETAPKTSSGVRKLTLPPLAQEALELQWERVSEGGTLMSRSQRDISSLIFPSSSCRPYSSWSINDGIKRFCRETGLPPLTAHQLRHYHASLLIREGLPLTLVSRRLGHATPEVTARIYAHWLGEDDALAADAVTRALQKEPFE